MSFYDLLLAKKLSGGGSTPSQDFEINDVTALFYRGARLNEYNKYMNALSETPTGASNMFSNCSSLTTLDLSNLNTSNFTDLSNMFTGCMNISNINLSNFNTSKVTNMSNMFYLCQVLQSLDLSSFDFSITTNVSNMFLNCSSLTSLVIGKNDTSYSNINNSSGIFSSCSNLDSITINGTTVLPLTSSNVFTGLKSTCKFYVPRNLVDTYKNTVYWATKSSYIFAIEE